MSPKRSCGTMRPDRYCNPAATRTEVGRKRPLSGQVLPVLCNVSQTSNAAYRVRWLRGFSFEPYPTPLFAPIPVGMGR